MAEASQAAAVGIPPESESHDQVEEPPEGTE